MLVFFIGPSAQRALTLSVPQTHALLENLIQTEAMRRAVNPFNRSFSRLSSWSCRHRPKRNPSDSLLVKFPHPPSLTRKLCENGKSNPNTILSTQIVRGLLWRVRDHNQVSCPPFSQ